MRFGVQIQVEIWFEVPVPPAPLSELGYEYTDLL